MDDDRIHPEEMLPTIPGQFVCRSLYPGRRLVPASFRPAPSCRRRTTPAGVGGLRVCDLQHTRVTGSSRELVE